jgi:hypothetical protein
VAAYRCASCNFDCCSVCFAAATAPRRQLPVPTTVAAKVAPSTVPAAVVPVAVATPVPAVVIPPLPTPSTTVVPLAARIQCACDAGDPDKEWSHTSAFGC